MPTTNRLTPKDLLRQRLIGEIAVSPDGRQVVYAERTVVDGADRTGLWIVPSRGGRARRLTGGAWTDGRPRFAPDGATLAFTSDRENEITQVWLLPMEGGDATRLTEFKRGVTEFEWMPNGRAVAVIATDGESHVLVGEREKGTATARVLRRVDWRSDDDGLLDHPTHVHLVQLSGRARRLTEGPWFASCVTPHPDGTQIGFLADRGERRDIDPLAQLHVVDVRSRRVRVRSKLPGHAVRASFDADGTPVCVAVMRHPAMSDDPQVLYRVERNGRAVALTAELDRFAGEGDTTDERLTIVHDDGNEIPFRVTDDGIGPPLVDPALGPGVQAVAEGGGNTVALMTLGSVSDPDVYAVEPGVTPRQLTRSGQAWSRGRAQPVQEELEIRGPGGKIQAFVLSPPNARKRPLPTILEIHGGPTWAWNRSPNQDTKMWTSAGYRVVRPNIRGSYNRGRDWIAPLLGDWGGVDAADCHAVLNHLVKAGLSDPKRLGCYGNSYGGFMVNWLVGTSDRFAAAVSSNGVANQVAAFANCDVGVMYNESEGLGTTLTPEGIDSLWRQSPLRNVVNITTPLLILQGEADLRCPPADNEQLFVALRALEREVEYVLFPESSHGMRYLARPDRRVDRAERILAWFKKYL